jgi:L-histidine Nalpha-methyltransferase
MKTQTISGVNLIEIPRSSQEETFAHAVAEGLSKPQKCLPCRFFYDAVGSEIFEQLCELPEYYVTRTERKILEAYAPEIIEAAGQGLALVEFGSGSSSKTRLLIDAIFTRQKRLHYIPVDISSEFLLTSSIALLNEYDGLSITAIAAEYNAALPTLSQQSQAPRLFLFLGSNIGNFDPGEAVEFISKIGQQMTPTDRLLIGFDLVKDRSIIEAAYNDAAEVTAAFNKNLLTRINTELGGDFDLDGFAHHAPFVEEHSRIEMRLISQREQTVHIDAIDTQFHFEPAEYIHTENSYKYTFDSFGQICHAAGLEIQERWTDERSWFAVAMLRKL